MKLLEDRILAEGNVLSPAILKVDSFINHQVDPVFMHELGAEIARHFRGQGINKVMTIESSGIAPAVFVAMELQVPLVILKKQSSAILKTDVIQTEVVSFTKEISYQLTLARKYLSENDHVLLVDDFLANGEAATGAIRLIRKAHATIAGIGILIEKSFQPGRTKLNEQGIHVYSLARIAEMDTDHITFLPEEA
ncbi:MAG: xanthine phosphoribosyltransferase [Lachnospiraceae bacterium]|nr:xanthine phosphoribosyltransferase [Oscillospiraceae bacterium]MDY5540705.1 xanthine phosphoribosyltransferase [Lachnospiraceae bacterium]MDY5647625.1 xanthine phosphoribosyltransferase [Lachnospiraceae bacterium]